VFLIKKSVFHGNAFIPENNSHWNKNIFTKMPILKCLANKTCLFITTQLTDSTCYIHSEEQSKEWKHRTDGVPVSNQGIKRPFMLFSLLLQTLVPTCAGRYHSCIIQQRINLQFYEWDRWDQKNCLAHPSSKNELNSISCFKPINFGLICYLVKGN
jgi:hypothetical protein